jgi:hypothetical protein
MPKSVFIIVNELRYMYWACTLLSSGNLNGLFGLNSKGVGAEPSCAAVITVTSDLLVLCCSPATSRDAADR